MGTAYTVYTNGEQILAVGEFGTTPAKSDPYYLPQVVDLPPVSDRIEFIYHVSNFHHRKGGAWEVIRLGTKEQLYRLREQRLAFDLILFGSILIIGLYHLVLFSLRQKDKSAIYFGLFCILIAIRLLATVERYLLQIFHQIDWELFVKVEYLSIYLAVPIFALFLHSLFKQDFHKLILKFILMVGLLFSILVLITPVRIFSHTIIVYQLFIVAGFIYGSYVLLRAAILKREGTLIILTGYLILFITATNDILDINEIIQTGHFIQLGMFAFILSQAVLLSYRYSRAFVTIERQREEIALSNVKYKKEISERKQVEKELKESSFFLQESQRVSRLGTYQLDIPSGLWTSCYILDDIFGITDTFIRDVEGWIKIVHPDQREEILAYFQNEVLGQCKPFDREYRIARLNDKEERWVRGLGELDYDADGNPIKMIGTVQDITEQKQLEEQLRQAQKMEAIGQLAGGVAHDFNNLLAAIIGFSEIGISQSAGNDIVAESFDRIIRKSQQGAKLVSQLLAFSSKQLLDVKPLNLNAIVDEATEFFQRVIGEDIELDTELDPRLATIEADPAALNQVITNLSINARDAMPEGGKLEIRTQNIVLDNEFYETCPWATPGSYVKLIVRDTGIGMDEETKKHIFNPFFTTKERWEGTGLGLSMVYGIVKQHNGHIDFFSEVGEGTTFEIYFPVIISESEIREEKRKPEQDVQEGTETILFVEDDPDVTMVGRKMLEQSGYTVLTAEDGVDAIKIFKDNEDTIDLVITDVILPRKSGVELYSEIRKINPDIKFLFISGYTGIGIHKKYDLKEGMELLQKPFLTSEITAKIRTVLDR